MTNRALPCGGKTPLVEGGADVVFLRGSESKPAYRCFECGYIFFDPPDPDFLRHYYNGEYPSSAASWYNAENDYHPHRCFARFHRISTIAERFLSTRDALYHEAGCAFGGTVAMFVMKGYDATGTDVNETAIQEAHARGNKAVFAEPEAAFLNRTGRQIDVLFSFHAVEHMPRPDLFLETIRGCLTARGIVVIFVPNAMAAESIMDSFHCNPWFAYPDHLHLFSARSALCLAQKTGYELLDVNSGMISVNPSREPAILGAPPDSHVGKVRAHLIQSAFMGPELGLVLTPTGSQTAGRLAEQIAAVRIRCEEAGNKETVLLKLCAERGPRPQAEQSADASPPAPSERHRVRRQGLLHRLQRNLSVRKWRRS
jgi:SAM-dependent methyltransferase